MSYDPYAARSIAQPELNEFKECGCANCIAERYRIPPEMVSEILGLVDKMIEQFVRRVVTQSTLTGRAIRGKEFGGLLTLHPPDDFSDIEENLKRFEKESKKTQEEKLLEQRIHWNSHPRKVRK